MINILITKLLKLLFKFYLLNKYMNTYFPTIKEMYSENAHLKYGNYQSCISKILKTFFNINI